MQQPGRRASMMLHLNCYTALRDMNISRSIALPGHWIYAGLHSGSQKTEQKLVQMYSKFFTFQMYFQTTRLCLQTYISLSAKNFDRSWVISVQNWVFS